ncbi:SDR family NAD(P)-dependent oxidoreductase [Nostocoides sp. HKS02]|nr:SDR family NAD(P)-dependent oxidoreductase [Tetrasphaera sp. HKS02]
MSIPPPTTPPTGARTALVTGGSAGLGRALATALVAAGWFVITDGRDADRLTRAAAEWGSAARVVPGDVTDADHRRALVEAVTEAGRLDLLVHNASTLGPTPLPPLARLDLGALDDLWHTNVAAPLALTQSLLLLLERSGGALVSISSDAAVEHYEGWGGYAASKAALDHLTLTLGAENPWLAAYAVDPGDMRTAMHQAAFPGEDIGDRPLPETVVPHLLALVRQRPPSGRYRAAEVSPSRQPRCGHDRPVARPRDPVRRPPTAHRPDAARGARADPRRRAAAGGDRHGRDARALPRPAGIPAGG